MSNHDDNLPIGWLEVPLGEIVQILDHLRIPVSAKERAFRQGSYPYYGANGQAGTIDDFIFEGDYVLLAEDGGFFNDPYRGVAYRAIGKFWVNNHAHILKPLCSMDTSFIVNYLNSIKWMPYVSGTTRLKLTQGSMRKVPFLLPPLPEQNRISKKLEALQLRSSKAKKALETIPPLLTKFRQSVLSSAFRGDLTAEWRAQNPDVEPAEKLLERIRKERRKRWEEEELAKMKAKGKKPKDDKWKDKYKEPEPVDTTDLPELPEGWCWAALEELGDWFGGGTPSKSVLSYWPNGTIPWVSPKDMKLPVIMETVYYINEKPLQDSTSNLLPEGSILIVTRSGILRRTLPVALAGVDLSINQDLKGLKLEEGLRPVYVFEALNSLADSIREQCAKAGTTVESIVFERLLRFPIPIASENEQAIIAKKLRELNQKIETIKITVLVVHCS